MSANREEKTLFEYMYPLRPSYQSCFKLPSLPDNVYFEHDPDSISLLRKFTGPEDPYLFLREFEEVANLVQYAHIPSDVIRLKFIPFALKDDAKSGCIVYLFTPFLIGMNLLEVS